MKSSHTESVSHEIFEFRLLLQSLVLFLIFFFILSRIIFLHFIFLFFCLGLIPIKADPNMFEYVVDEEETDADTLVFHLEYICPDLPSHIERDGDGFPILTK